MTLQRYNFLSITFTISIENVYFCKIKYVDYGYRKRNMGAIEV